MNISINLTALTRASETDTNKYLIQTRSQAKSSHIKVPEIDGVNKGLNPHVKPERQKPLPSLPTHSSPTTNLAQPVDKGPPTQIIPKPRIGQGRAGLRKEIRTNQPIPLPKQACLLNQYLHLLQRKHCHCLSP